LLGLALGETELAPRNGGLTKAEQNSTFPVGKVTFLDLYPLSFLEWLRGTGAENLAAYVDEIEETDPLPSAFATPLTEQLKSYFVTGGMPDVVNAWNDTHSTADVERALDDLIDSYDRDFAKHAGAALYAKISAVWRSLPAQLSRENKKFIYGLVREGARAREYEDAITWLCATGLVHRVYRVKKPGLPLSAYEDERAFKLYGLDVGVMRRLSRLAPSAFGEGPRLFTEFKGALTENFVAQELAALMGDPAYYWTWDKPAHEIDFLVQVENDVVPIKVKSGVSVGAPSLRYYRKKYAEQTPLGLRLSLKNLEYNDGLLNLPLYLTGKAPALIRQCLTTL